METQGPMHSVCVGLHPTLEDARNVHLSYNSWWWIATPARRGYAMTNTWNESGEEYERSQKQRQPQIMADTREQRVADYLRKKQEKLGPPTPKRFELHVDGIVHCVDDCLSDSIVNLTIELNGNLIDTNPEGLGQIWPTPNYCCGTYHGHPQRSDHRGRLQWGAGPKFSDAFVGKDGRVYGVIYREENDNV